ncbi:MAG: Uma2 family endonuclease [Acidobacteria bacterium]|nr:Uma2 family endonuclease [Acidobacteriota bacterium]
MAQTATTERRFTYADLLLLPDDGMRHEIIDGVHYVTASPTLGHQDLVGRLHLAIGNHIAIRRHLGRVFLAPLDVVLSEYDVVEPDLLFVAGYQQDILTEANVRGMPALVVEVLSPGTRRRDEGIKRKLFDRSGAQEYWMVDPKALRVIVCRRAADGSLKETARLTNGDDAVLTSPLLPEFSLAVDDLFSPW